MVQKAFTLIAMIALLACCGSALSGAKTDFKSGRISEAKDKLVALEPESQSWTGSQRAEYILYRGLVLHSLGDRDGASKWLREAKEIEDSHPKTFSDDDRARLELALDSLGPNVTGVQ
jgi:hypothetical protein